MKHLFTKSIMRQSNRIFFDLKNQYHTITKTPSSSYIPCFETLSILYPTLQDDAFQKEIKKIVPIHCDSIVPFLFPDNQIGNKMKASSFDRTGAWHIQLKNGGTILMARYMESLGRNRQTSTILVCRTQDFMTFRKIGKAQEIKNDTPKLGVFRVIKNQFGGLGYEEVTTIPSSKIVHPKFEYFIGKIPAYFANIKQYLQYKRPGLKKILLAGEPGTSKSSMFYYAAEKYKDKYSIVFSSNIQAVVYHLKNCAKYKVPAIVFYEDCEADLYTGDSGLRNFLDGINTPRNIAGSMLIMSTNQPQFIDSTISERPGRIGEIIHIGALENEWARDCAKLYFGKYLKKDEDYKQLHTVFNGRTGDQIRFLLELSKDFSIENAQKIDVQMIKDMWKKIESQIMDIKLMAKATSKGGMFKKDRVGFKLADKNNEESMVHAIEW